jgi:hypothetical protein
LYLKKTKPESRIELFEERRGQNEGEVCNKGDGGDECDQSTLDTCMKISL